MVYNELMAKGTSKTIEWKAAESIDHERSTSWYIVLYGIAVVLIGLCVWAQLWTTIGLIIVVVVALQVVGSKPARMISYSLSPEGLTVNDKLHPYSEYRGFGVRHDGHFWQLVLLPTARFAAETSIFIRDEHGEEIVDFLGKILPMEQLNKDFIGHIARKLKL
jgi:hypothetical protein